MNKKHPEHFKLAEKILEFIKVSRNLSESDLTKKFSKIGNLSGIEYRVFNEDQSSFDKYLKESWELITAIKKNFTLEYFKKAFFDQVVRYYLENENIYEAGVNRFINGLLSFREREFIVITEFFGIELEDKSKPLEIGPFTIYKCPEHKDEIKKDFIKWEEWPFDKTNQSLHEYLISCKVIAHHTEEARNFAELKFLRFERICKFMLAWCPPSNDVGIYNYRRSQLSITRVASEDNEQNERIENKEFLNIMKFEDLLKAAKARGLDDVWNMLTEDNLSEIKKRLLLAMEWTGRAKNDFSLETKFLDVIFSLEILFGVSKEGVFTPGIGHKIAESVALILGSTADKSIEIESDIKELFRIRGSIVHAGKDRVSEDDFNKLMNHVLPIIVIFFNNPTFSKINKTEELDMLLKSIKYS